IECNKCVIACPHAAIRARALDPACLEDAPADYPTLASKIPGYEGLRYLLQVAPEDCTGCSLCVQVCPAKDRANPNHKALDMAPVEERLPVERSRWDYFRTLPETDRRAAQPDVRGTQLLEPLFEFSGACSGCG